MQEKEGNMSGVYILQNTSGGRGGGRISKMEKRGGYGGKIKRRGGRTKRPERRKKKPQKHSIRWGCHVVSVGGGGGGEGNNMIHKQNI